MIAGRLEARQRSAIAAQSGGEVALDVGDDPAILLDAGAELRVVPAERQRPLERIIRRGPRGAINVHQPEGIQGRRSGQRQVRCRGRVEALLAQRDRGAMLLAPPADHRVAAQGLTPRFDLGDIGPRARRYRDIVLDSRIEPTRTLAFPGLRQRR